MSAPMRWQVTFKPPYQEAPLVLYVDAKTEQEAWKKTREYVASYTSILASKPRPDLVGGGPHRAMMVRGPLYPDRVAS